MSDEMTDTERRLLDSLRQVLDSGFRHADCCSVANQRVFEGTPDVRHPQQPPEVWSLMMRYIAGQVLFRARIEVELAVQKCQSPIEELMLLALYLVAYMHAGVLGSVSLRRVWAPQPAGDAAFHLLPQATIGQCRVDFLVTAWSRAGDDTWRSGAVVVECDGHDFHEKTKDQASRDKARDREIQKAGYVVFRYSGSDVWQRHFECAAEVVREAVRIAGGRP